MAKGSKRIDDSTQRQKLFAYAYFNNGGNGARAAIEAGYSQKSAKEIASELLTYPNVQNIIKALNEEIRERAIVTKEQVARELVKVGFADIRQLFDDNSKLKDVKEIPDDIAAALSTIEIDQLWGATMDGKEQIGETKKVKLWDKLKALSQLADLYGFNAPVKTAQTKANGEDVQPTVIKWGDKEIHV